MHSTINDIPQVPDYERSREARDEQNRHMRRMVTVLDLCIQDLIAMGFTVRRFDVLGRSHPVVWIDASPRCDKLGGALYVRQYRAGVTDARYTAIFDACEVRWTERLRAGSQPAEPQAAPRRLPA